MICINTVHPTMLQRNKQKNILIYIKNQVINQNQNENDFNQFLNVTISCFFFVKLTIKQYILINMNELKGKCVNVVLGIREGRGFNFLKKSTYIIANFNGRTMETDSCDAVESPCFNTELVWESEKKDVRKVRSSNTPLRVELHTNDTSQKKEIVGFTLLSLRSAPVIVNCDLEVPYKWYKLLGTPSECKGTHPELYLSLTLRDHLINNELPRALPYIMEDVEITNVYDKEIVPVRFIQDGFIQIGNDDSSTNEIFHFTVLMKSTYNLDLLLPKDLVFTEITDKYYLIFDMLGLSINSKPFYKDLHKEIILNEKIVLKIQSNFDILKDFFEQKAEVQIFLNYAQQRLGSLKLNLKGLMPDITIDEYKDIYNRRLTMQEIAYFSSSMDLLNDDKYDRKPCIEVISTLDLVEQAPTVEIGAGEREFSNNSSGYTFKPTKDSSQTKIIVKDIQKFDAERPDLRKPYSPINTKPIPNYKVYTLLVMLEYITWKRRYDKEFSVVFNHPQAKTKLIVTLELDSYNLRERVLLNDAKCKMYYVTSLENLPKIIEAWPPSIRIVSSHESNYFNEIQFKFENVTRIENPKWEYSYVTNLCKGDEIIADVSVLVFIDQLDEKQQERTNFDMFPYILDEEVALREIDDFAKWKENEKSKYLTKLKKQEKEFMVNFKNKWTTRKNELEQKLLDNINRCKTLNNQLKRTSIALKVKETFEEKRNEFRCRENYVFDDEVYKNSLKYKHLDNNELIQKITETKEENECLQEIIDEQQVEIEKFKKSTLTNEQTGNLLQELRSLQEKYEELQRSKNYFKDQWKKSVREIHQLKTEGQSNIKKQIKTNLEELSNLSLDDFLNVKQQNASNVPDFIDDNDDCKDTFFGFCTNKCCSEFNTALNNK